MSSFSESLAHPDDPLMAHLEAVADAADEALDGAPPRVRRAAVLMGLLHDAGKATRWFQAYLTGDASRSDHTNHSLLGAVLAHRILQEAKDAGEASEWLHWTVVAGIQRHHGDFDRDLKRTLSTWRERALGSGALRDQLEAFDAEGFRAWLEPLLQDRGFTFTVPDLAEEAIRESISSFLPGFGDEAIEVAEDGFDVLAAFGTFVGADKMHTAHADWERKARALPPEIVETYKENEFGEPDDELDQHREEIYQEVIGAIESEDDNWIYTLTAPTGSGKTLTGLAAGLHLKQQKQESGKDSRLVYCLPFTSVIDQNSGVYEDVLQESDIPIDDPVLLKHHHLTDPRYEADGEPIVDGGELLVETWESEIIVTTFHQLVHTIFTSKRTNLKRFAALRDAIVVLDEVQAIPHEHWEDVRRAMELAAERLGATFVLMTATMPLIVDPDETPELLASHPDRYEHLARTELQPRVDDPMTVDELATEIREAVHEGEDKRRIVIVNRRKTARRLYRHLEELPIPIGMLSTDLTPLDRERVIQDLGLEDPEAEDAFVLVSTQVIEAGVDVSSDVLIREIAPLDSIIQSAGRCNREFELRPDRGRIEVVELQKDGGSLAVPPYSSFLIESTLEVLEASGEGGVIDEARFHELAREYYRILQERSTSASAIDLLGRGDVHKLDDPDEGFRLIEDGRPEQAHFIIQDDEDREIWQEYQAIQNLEVDSAEDYREKKRQFREIKRRFTKRIVNYPTNERPEEEVIPVELEDGAYDSETGLQRNLAEDSFAFI